MDIKNYLTQLHDIQKQGDAREESFYPALQDFLYAAAADNNRNQAHVTPLPKKTEGGNPDFRVWDGRNHIVGYVEAKPPTVEDLDRVEDTEQLKRYRDTFPNVILTNFCEFRLYRNGERVAKVSAARPFVLTRWQKVPPVEKEAELQDLLSQFFAFSLPRSYTASQLAVELAKRTRFLHNIVERILNDKEEAGHCHWDIRTVCRQKSSRR